MSVYDYRAGKKRIDAILNNKLEVKTQHQLPSDDNFTFDNGYYSWITAIFVDLRNSSTLFANGDKEKVAKIIRCFTSEVIEILRHETGLREIGIRGDCVYAVYTTPLQSEIYKLALATWYINTYMNMLNITLKENGISQISAGIGMATAEELVVKAGRKDVGINNKVWIGKAVTLASNLSSLGNKGFISPLVYSDISYNNFIGEFIKDHTKDETEIRGWFRQSCGQTYGTYYHASIINPPFDEWISNGMKD